MTEDMLPFLRRLVTVEFLCRSRGLWSKTFGLAWRVLRVSGDVFHVNYGLQDAWLVRKLKRLDVLWLHGSDIREALQTRKFAWMVQGNLESAGRVFVATQDLIRLVAPYRNDVCFLPRPVRTDLFMMKERVHNPLRAVYFPKSYDKLPHNLRILFRENKVQFIRVHEPVPYTDMPHFLRGFDIFVDQTTLPELSKTCLEAMSTGLATYTYFDRCNMTDRINQLSNPDRVIEESGRNREFVLAHHSAEKIANQLVEVWENCRR